MSVEIARSRIVAVFHRDGPFGHSTDLFAHRWQSGMYLSVVERMVNPSAKSSDDSFVVHAIEIASGSSVFFAC